MQDPLKYFRIEAREIVEQLQSGVLELERAAAPAEATSRLLRLAHTLKGAARVVRQLEIAALAHGLEELLLPFRGRQNAAAATEIEALLGPVDTIAKLVSGLAPAPSAVVAAPAAVTTAVTAAADAPRSADVGSSGDVSPERFAVASAASLEHVESLLDGALEVGQSLAALREAMLQLEQARRQSAELMARLEPRRLAELSPEGATNLQAMASEIEARLAKLSRGGAASLERAQRELSLLRDRVEQLRLVPVSSIFGRLERGVRDAAVSLGRQANFEAKGGETRLDADVLVAVERALAQAVRNAVAHGIESAEERQRAGKPTLGRVRLQVERIGSRVVFRCQDDGRGVDLQEVRRRAVRQGRLPAAGSADTAADELFKLLLEGGLSTARDVTEVSGRGVGLNLIREALAGVGGDVTLETRSGAGTVVVLSVPVDVAALEGLLVEAAGDVHVLPLDAVVCVKRVAARELGRSAEGEIMSFEEQAVRFVALGSLLGADAGGSERAVWSAVVVRASSGLLALGVDRLHGNDTVVARALPASVELESCLAGVTLDVEGNPRLLLDPEGLYAALARAPVARPRERAARPVILVVDDSLTTRMLEQSILESAGYEVELATSAEEGLERARARPHDLFLVDVEMPGMDGFTFVQRVRADPKLAGTPAVLVTSRASPEDRKRGQAVGASGHIAKGEFDQLSFLSRVRELVG